MSQLYNVISPSSQIILHSSNPKIGSLDLLEGNYWDGHEFCRGGGDTGVGGSSVFMIVGVYALLVNFIEFMMTSPPKLTIQFLTDPV